MKGNVKRYWTTDEVEERVNQKNAALLAKVSEQEKEIAERKDGNHNLIELIALHKKANDDLRIQVSEQQREIDALRKVIAHDERIHENDEADHQKEVNELTAVVGYTHEEIDRIKEHHEKELASLRSENERMLESYDEVEQLKIDYTERFIKLTNNQKEWEQEISKLKAERQELVEALREALPYLTEAHENFISFDTKGLTELRRKRVYYAMKEVAKKIAKIQSLLSKFPEVPSTP